MEYNISFAKNMDNTTFMMDMGNELRKGVVEELSLLMFIAMT